MQRGLYGVNSHRRNTGLVWFIPHFYYKCFQNCFLFHFILSPVIFYQTWRIDNKTLNLVVKIHPNARTLWVSTITFSHTRIAYSNLPVTVTTTSNRLWYHNQRTSFTFLSVHYTGWPESIHSRMIRDDSHTK